MALREIKVFGDDILRKKCREVTDFNEKLWILLDDMYETMVKADGIGLAAPQVGILRRVIVINIEQHEKGSGRIELVNPVITQMKGRQHEIEGCLSYSGKFGYVDRPAKIKLHAQNRFGKDIEYKAEGLLARAMCHEVDHLNGILFSDKVTEWAKEETKRR